MSPFQCSAYLKTRWHDLESPIQVRALLLAFCLLLAACTVGVTITNAPSTLPDCMGTKGSTGGCR